MEALDGQRVTLRPVVEGDLPRLATILAEPDVARWWHGYDEARIRRDLLEGDGAWSFAIEGEGRVVGAIQAWEQPEPDYRHAGIDLFLAAEAQGRGLGPDAIRTLARWLIEGRGHHRLVIDPAWENRRAIAAYEKVGFRQVGVLRRYERGPDGSWRDGMLLELLAEELR